MYSTLKIVSYTLIKKDDGLRTIYLKSNILI